MVDSASAVAEAQDAIVRYEFIAHHYWPSRAASCDSRKSCAVCVAVPGRAPCVMGRYLPCDELSARRRDGYEWIWDQCIDVSAIERGLPAQDFADVSAALDHLRQLLTQTHALAPRDPFIAGQRVFYTFLAGRPDSARHVAAECGATPSWCRRLQGMVAQHLGLSAAADSLFSLASVDLRPAERCEWHDVSHLLTDTSEARTYGALACGTAQREEFERRFWIYSDPSWIVAGNDRRTEHLARAVEARLQDDMLAIPCRASLPACVGRRGNTGILIKNEGPERRRRSVGLIDQSRDLIRYGARESWRRSRPQDTVVRIAGQPALLGCGGTMPKPASEFDRFSIQARYHFAPEAVGEGPVGPVWNVNSGPEIGVSGLPRPEDCDPRPMVAERFTPRYAGVVEGMTESQTGVFRRLDGSLAVAAAASSRLLSGLLEHSPELSASWEASAFGFSVGQGTRDGASGGFGAAIDSTGRIGALIPYRGVQDGDLVVGLEALLPGQAANRLGSSGIADPAFAGSTLIGASPEKGVLVRFRAFVPGFPRDAQRLSISDVILLSASDSAAPLSLESAAARMLSSTRLTKDRVLLYWEAYGLRAGDSVSYGLRVIPKRIERGTWESLWRRLRFAPADAPMLIQWREQFTSRVSRSMTLGLSQIPNGEYVLELSATMPGQAPVTVLRPLVIAR